MIARLLMARWRLWQWRFLWLVADASSRLASRFADLSEWAMRRARSI